jgi:hypothetical protein
MDTQEGSLHQEFLARCEKTFDEAREDPPPAQNALRTPAEGDPSASSTSANPSPSATPSSPFCSAEPAEPVADINNLHRNQRREP